MSSTASSARNQRRASGRARSASAWAKATVVGGRHDRARYAASPAGAVAQRVGDALLERGPRPRVSAADGRAPAARRPRASSPGPSPARERRDEVDRVDRPPAASVGAVSGRRPAAGFARVRRGSGAGCSARGVLDRLAGARGRLRARAPRLGRRLLAGRLAAGLLARRRARPASARLRRGLRRGRPALRRRPPATRGERRPAAAAAATASATRSAASDRTPFVASTVAGRRRSGGGASGPAVGWGPPSPSSAPGVGLAASSPAGASAAASSPSSGTRPASGRRASPGPAPRPRPRRPSCGAGGCGRARPLGKLRSSSRASAPGLRDMRVRAPLMTSSASAVCGSAAASSAAGSRRSCLRAACTSRRALRACAPPEEFTSRPSRRLVSGQRWTAYSSWTSRVFGAAPDPVVGLVAAADPLLGQRLQHDLRRPRACSSRGQAADEVERAVERLGVARRGDLLQRAQAQLRVLVALDRGEQERALELAAAGRSAASPARGASRVGATRAPASAAHWTCSP